MSNLRLYAIAAGAISLTLASQAQITSLDQLPGEKINAAQALDRSMKASSLTDGGRPFHALLEIGEPSTPFSGKVEVWWMNPNEFKSIASSPAFTQTRIVNGGKVMETDQGDYYPRWLENFVDAILNPVPMLPNFANLGGVVTLGPQITSSCLRRDDRPGGITDQLTWGMVCFAVSEPHLTSVLTMNYNVEFKDWKGFGRQQIARTYTTDVLDYKEISARLVSLEELKHPDDSLFSISSPTPANQQISTAFVSTLQEESLIEKAPVIEWPTVREGKTDGYMIVYARTDRTGRVRETAKHNSDQPGLESFGMEQALRYKFKPLLVDGLPVQMEMPLVLHFKTKIADPIPILTGADLKRQVTECDITLTAAEAPPRDRILRMRVSVNEAGNLTGEQFGPWLDSPVVARLTGDVRSCRFAPLLRNGVPTYYKGDLELLKP